MRNIRPGTRSSGTGVRREVSDSSGRGQWVGCLAGAADALCRAGESRRARDILLSENKGALTATLGMEFKRIMRSA